jgi:hypothetical protein
MAGRKSEHFSDEEIGTPELVHASRERKDAQMFDFPSGATCLRRGTPEGDTGPVHVRYANRVTVLYLLPPILSMAALLALVTARLSV